MYKLNEKAITFLPLETIEEEAKKQIELLSKMPFIFKHIAIMPDCHMGKGACVGSVIATKGAIIPAAVGVDIGCGMIAVKTNLTKNQFKDLEKLRISIERSIPMSMGKFNTKISETAQKRIDELAPSTNEYPYWNQFSKNWRESLGTLGAGNHFIEICTDENNAIWITLHSGSRGIGNQIAQHHIKIAQALCKKFQIQLEDPELAYLPEGTPEFDDYIHDLNWAQKFALLNREEMMDNVIKDIRYHIFGNNEEKIELERINCHHNFTQIENHFGENVWITRKGAIQAKLGMPGMIPGSMGTETYIVEGLENKMAFHSAPHGAGRNFSRTEARKRFTMMDLEKAMEGKEWRKTDAFIDEIPEAYKNIQTVMENAKDLVKITHTLKQFINMKGD